MTPAPAKAKLAINNPAVTLIAVSPQAASDIPAPAEENAAQYKALKALLPPLHKKVRPIQYERYNEPAAIIKPDINFMDTS
jgi:hypothetical protein